MDPFGLLLAIAFVSGCLLLIPLNNYLDRREAERRRNQAHQRRKGRW